MDQCHIHGSMCHRAVAWTIDVLYVCAIGLSGLIGFSGKVAPN